MNKLPLCIASLALTMSIPLAVSAEEKQHPTVEHAITALEQTKAELENGEHGFGGHRSKAIEDIDAALKELHLALDYAHDHPESIKPAGQ